MINNKKNKSLQIEAFINDDIDVFEPNYQSKFLKVFIEDKNNWAQQIIDIIFPDYFDGYHKILVDYEMEFFKKYRVPANYDDLKEMANDKEKDELLKEHIYGLIDKIKALEIEHQKKEFIKQRAYDYFKSSSVKNTIIEIATDWKKNAFGTMMLKLKNALNAGEPKDSGHNYATDVEKRLKDDLRNAIPILPGLDEYIGGGAGVGELISFMAPTGGGKSMMLVQNAVTAIKVKKKVVYFTLELSEEVVGQRFDACFNNILLGKVTKFKEVIIENIKELGINLRIKRYSDGVATVNTFYAYLEYLKCNENFIPDLIVVDYADNMKPLEKGEQLRHDLMQIYRELRALAIDMKCPVLTASQITGETRKEIELSMAAESKGKNNISDIVIGFGRDVNQLDRNEASLKILKNRTGPIGKILPIHFDSSMVLIEVIQQQQQHYSNIDKNAIIGIESTARKRKDSNNINTYMGNNSNLNKVLENQGFTPEVKD
jgi:hypothetical protein